MGEVKIVEEVFVEVEDPTYMDLSIEGKIEHKVQEAVSLNALTGSSQGVNTVLVSGTVKNRSPTMFFDSGNTYCFIDQHTVIGAGYKASYCASVRVILVDDNYVISTSHYQWFKWKLQGSYFQYALLVIPLCGCDLILGNDLIKKYNPTNLITSRERHLTGLMLIFIPFQTVIRITLK